MTGLVLAILAGTGAYLVYTDVVLGWRDLRGLARPDRPSRARRHDWLVQAGLAEIPLRDLAAVVITLAVVGAASAYAVFGGPVPAVATGLFA
ncbi:MAG TPA: hypothetical protein VGA36_04560, partial [Nitriliruptorales bacterium]